MLDIEIIKTENAPAAFGPFPQGKMRVTLVFATGQLP